MDPENEQDIKELYIPNSQATGGETSNFIPQLFPPLLPIPHPPITCMSTVSYKPQPELRGMGSFLRVKWTRIRNQRS